MFKRLLNWWSRFTGETPHPMTPGVRVPEVRPEFDHRHDWRYITEYAMQCRTKQCGAVDYRGDVPDGMQDYVNLMSTRKAALDPLKESLEYSRARLAFGRQCSVCGRTMVEAHSRFYCPYCGAGVQTGPTGNDRMTPRVTPGNHRFQKQQLAHGTVVCFVCGLDKALHEL